MPAPDYESAAANEVDEMRRHRLVKLWAAGKVRAALELKGENFTTKTGRRSWRLKEESMSNRLIPNRPLFVFRQGAQPAQEQRAKPSTLANG
jgi:hypothetical protein